MPLTLADLELVCFNPAVHDIGKFDCTDADLNEFLEMNAQRYHHQCLSHTRLAFSKNVLVGYITLLADSIILKSSEKRRLFDFHQSIFTFPALKIGKAWSSPRVSQIRRRKKPSERCNRSGG